MRVGVGLRWGSWGHLAEVKCNLVLLQIHTISKGQRPWVDWEASENTINVSFR